MLKPDHPQVELNLIFYSDPGHAWLAVKKTLLDALGIAGEISSYSYMRGRTVYLEEDCDAPFFLRKAKEAGIVVRYTDKHTDARHPIRGYSRYTNLREVPV